MRSPKQVTMCPVKGLSLGSLMILFGCFFSFVRSFVRQSFILIYILLCPADDIRAAFSPHCLLLFLLYQQQPQIEWARCVLFTWAALFRSLSIGYLAARNQQTLPCGIQRTGRWDREAQHRRSRASQEDGEEEQEKQREHDDSESEKKVKFASSVIIICIFGWGYQDVRIWSRGILYLYYIWVDIEKNKRPQNRLFSRCFVGRKIIIIAHLIQQDE